ncbi:MAG: type II secretion system protein GspN [bacterium]
MGETSKRTLIYAGYAVLGSFLTLYFMLLSFPFSEMKERLVPSLARDLSLPISVGQVEVTPLLWIRFSDVRIDPGAHKGIPALRADAVRLRPALLPLLIGKQVFKVRADLYGGTLKGSLGRKKDSQNVSLSWKGLVLGRQGDLPMAAGAKLAGTLSGTAALKIQGSNWTTAQGSVSGSLVGGHMQNVSLYGFSMPPLQGVTGDLELRLNQKKATLEHLSLVSDGLQLSLEGSADLLPRLPSSRLDLKGRLKLQGELAAQYQPMLAGVLRSQDAQGFSTFSLKGSLQAPRFVP